MSGVEGVIRKGKKAWNDSIGDIGVVVKEGGENISQGIEELNQAIRKDKQRLRKGTP